jgi:hypothetical protein
VWAISGCRARDGTTPLLVWDFVRVILETHDNSQNPFDDSAFLALLLGSITCVRACSPHLITCAAHWIYRTQAHDPAADIFVCHASIGPCA